MMRGGRRGGWAAVLLPVGVLVALAAAPGSATAAGCKTPPLSPNVRLTASPARVTAGTKVRFRIEDLGPGGVGFGPEYRIERCFGGSWSLASFTPHNPFYEILYAIQGETNTPWESSPVPANAAPGKYRVRKVIDGYGRDRPYFAVFRVVARASA
jgi:hypothetical protein